MGLVRDVSPFHRCDLIFGDGLACCFVVCFLLVWFVFVFFVCLLCLGRFPHV